MPNYQSPEVRTFFFTWAEGLLSFPGVSKDHTPFKRKSGRRQFFLPMKSDLSVFTTQFPKMDRFRVILKTSTFTFESCVVLWPVIKQLLPWKYLIQKINLVPLSK